MADKGDSSDEDLVAKFWEEEEEEEDEENGGESEDDDLFFIACMVDDIEQSEKKRKKFCGSLPGRQNVRRNITSGHDRLMADYFGSDPVYSEKFFRRRHRMSTSLFMRIVAAVESHDDYFRQRPNAVGVLGATSLQKVLKERFKIYCAVNDGIINLVDVFFDMTKLDAIKALDIYRRTGNLAQCLSDFYELCRGLELARNFQFPVLREPPSSFLGTMEEYIREAPRTDHVPNKTIEYRQLDFAPYQGEEQSPPPIPEPFEEPVAEEMVPEPEEEPQFVAGEEDDEPETPTTADLLGLHEVNPAVAALEESNALALAIVPPGGSTTPSIGYGDITGSSGWELALVPAPTTTTSSQLTESSKLAGGFDKLLLDSLYEDAGRRQQAATEAYGNGQVDPFAMSNGVAPPTSVQMSMMAQQQQAMLGMPQQFQPPYNGAASQFNPFGDAYSVVPFQSSPLHGSSSLI